MIPWTVKHVHMIGAGTQEEKWRLERGSNNGKVEISGDCDKVHAGSRLSKGARLSCIEVRSIHILTGSSVAAASPSRVFQCISHPQHVTSRSLTWGSVPRRSPLPFYSLICTAITCGQGGVTACCKQESEEPPSLHGR
jgi:hypothetical protein